MLPFFAAVLPVVILFCGLALDVGTLELRKIELQSAADAAALTWELQLERNQTSTQITTAVYADAGLNGFTNGANGVTIAMQQVASSGSYSTSYDALQVTVTQDVKTLFMGSLNGGITTVKAQAVALMPPCSTFLGTNTSNAWPWYGASASWYAPCPTYVNRGVTVDGFTNFNSPYGINVAGALTGSNVTGSTAVAPRYNAITVTDPLAALTAPSFSGTCTYSNVSVNGGAYVLGPGTYCGGVSVYNASITLYPGLYVFTGGVTISGSSLTGTGITMFFTQGGGSGFGVVKILAGSTIRLSAPNDASGGGVPNVLFYLDRNWVRTNNQDFQLSDSSYMGDGIIYSKSAGVSFWNMGTVGGPNYFGVVADSIFLYTSNLHPTMNFSNIPGGSPYRPAGGLVQ